MNMIVGAATMIGTAVAIEPDPVFAAIEAHRRAEAAFDEHARLEDRLDDEIPCERRLTRCGDEVVPTDDPRWIAYQRDYEALHFAEQEAEDKLADVVPTTLQGVRAMLAYAVEVEKRRGVPWSDDFADPEAPNRKLGRSFHYFVSKNLERSIAGMLLA